MDKVVIFDGMCHLCDGIVSRLIKWDKGEKLLFAANQSEGGQKILRKYEKEHLSKGTLFFLQDGQIFMQSTAVMKIMRLLPFPFFLLYAFIIIPAPLRDSLYTWVAENRYKWFGKRDTCRMPTPAETARFI